MIKCTDPEKQKADKRKTLWLLVHAKFLNKIINKIYGIDQPVNWHRAGQLGVVKTPVPIKPMTVLILFSQGPITHRRVHIFQTVLFEKKWMNLNEKLMIWIPTQPKLTYDMMK